MMIVMLMKTEKCDNEDDDWRTWQLNNFMIMIIIKNYENYWQWYYESDLDQQEENKIAI